MIRSALAAGCVLLLASVVFSQNCDLSNPNVFGNTCRSPINAGSATTCTMTITNLGSAPCSGTWSAAVGALDAGTVSNGTSNFGACSVASNVPLPGPIAGFTGTTVPSAFLCQGSTTL